jgi:hypothetical protein
MRSVPSLVGLRKTTKYLSEYSRPPGRNLKPAYPGYEIGADGKIQRKWLRYVTAPNPDVWGNGCIAPQFLTSTLGGSDLSSLFYRYTTGETTASIHCIGDWVCLWAGAEFTEKRKISCFCRKQTPNPRPSSSNLSHQTDWAIPAPFVFIVLCLIK